MMTRTIRGLVEHVFEKLLAVGPIRNACKPGRRPELETLEDRLALARCTFSNMAGGAWESPTNWTACNGGIPQAGDDVVLAANPPNNLAITLSGGSHRLRSLTATGDARFRVELTFTGGSLQIDGSVQISSHFIFTQNGGQLILDPRGSYTFSANARFNHLTGSIGLDPPSGQFPPIVFVGAVLNLGPSGTSQSVFEMRGSNSLEGVVTSRQTVLVQPRADTGNATLLVSTPLTNRGSLVLESSQACSPFGCAPRVATVDIVGTGRLVNGAGGEIRIPGTLPGAGSTISSAPTGVVANQGQISVSGSGELRIVGGTYEAAGGFVRGNAWIENASVRVTTSPPEGMTTTLPLRRTVSLLSDNLVRTSLVLQPRGETGNAVLRVSTPIINRGTLVIENGQACSPFGCELRTGTINVESAGQLVNERDSEIQVPGVGAAISVHSAAVVRNRGQISVTGSGDLRIAGGLFEADGGFLVGTGWVENGNVRTTSSPLSGIAILNLRQTVTVLGDILPSNHLVVQPHPSTGHATLVLASALSNFGTLEIQSSQQCSPFGCSPLVATVRGPAGGRWINSPNGVVTATGALFTVASEFSNQGTVNLSPATAPVGTFSGNFVNEQGGTVQGAGSLSMTGGSSFANSGLIAVPQGATLAIRGPFLNFRDRTLLDGTYRVSGVLRFDNADIGALAANIQLVGPSSAVLNTTNNNNAFVGLTRITDLGSLAVQDSGVFRPNGNLLNEGNLEVSNLADFSVPRNYTQGEAAVLTVDRARFRVEGIFTNYVSASQTLVGGTYRFVSDERVNGIFQFPNADILSSLANISLEGPTPPTAQHSIVDSTGNNALRNLTTNRGRLSVENGRSHVLSRPLTNEGTVAILRFDSTLTGDFTNLTNDTLSGGTFIVSGILRFTNGDGILRTNAANLTLRGQEARVLNFTGQNLLTTLITNAPDGQLTFENNHFTSSANLLNEGTLTSGTNTLFRVTGSFTQNGTVRVLAGGTLAADFGLTNFDSETGTLTGGSYHIAGTFQFGAANIMVNGAEITLDGPDAVVRNVAGLSAFRNFAANAGTFTLQNGAVLALPGAFENSNGLFIRGAGSQLTLGGDYTQTAGQTGLTEGSIDASLGRVLINDGVLAGTGTISGEVVNAGRLIVGGLRAVGVLTISGNYTQTDTGVLVVELGGTTAGLEHDQLNIEGVARLGGKLDVLLLDDYFPGLDDGFSVLTWSSLEGAFAEINVPNLGAELFLDSEYGDTGLSLHVRSR